MNWRGLVVGVALVTLMGCDSDGDGLSNAQEKDLGTNPDVEDTDGDGLVDGGEVDAGLDPMNSDSDADHLLDGDEALNGADPLLADTDDDGYLDGDEVLEGHNPNDKADRIYKGRWPYYYAKDEVKGQNLDFFEFGKRFARMEFVDQHGDMVDLYDFYNADKPIVIDISAEWCPPCNAISAWLDGAPNEYYSGIWAAGPEVIERGDVYWITILGQDNYGAPGYQALSERWFELYPTKAIPILADGAYQSVDFVGLGWWPTVLLLTPDLKVEDTGVFYAEYAMQALAVEFPE